MGINIDDLWGNIKIELNKGLDQVKKVGVPALQNGLEQWGAKVLEDQKNKLLGTNKETQKTLNTAVKEVLAVPSQPGSFGSFFSEGITGAGLNAKGPLILMGVAGVLILGFYIGKK